MAPTDADPTGEWYCFERGAKKDSGGLRMGCGDFRGRSAAAFVESERRLESA